MKKYWSIIVLLTLFSSCKDDDEFVIGKEILLNNSDSRSWALTKVVVDGIETEIPACEKDNVMTLHSDEKFSVDEGATKCGESQLAEEGIWWISDDNKEFYLLSTTQTSAKEGSVTSLSESNFSFKQVKDSVTTEWYYQAR